MLTEVSHWGAGAGAGTGISKFGNSVATGRFHNSNAVALNWRRFLLYFERRWILGLHIETKAGSGDTLRHIFGYDFKHDFFGSNSISYKIQPIKERNWVSSPPNLSLNQLAFQLRKFRKFYHTQYSSLNCHNVDPEPSVVGFVWAWAINTVPNPVHSCFVKPDIVRVRVGQPSCTVSVSSKPPVDAIVACALVHAGNVFAAIWVQGSSIIPVICGLPLEVAAALQRNRESALN
jgi:hypothetical protein